MGVHGLWELLSPIGVRVSNDHVQGKTLAIDVSIWLTQFIKAMREAEGAQIRNAHLLGVFRRCLKLLFLSVRPVLIFDGATPAIKRRTLASRHALREKHSAKLKRLAERLLLNQIKVHAVNAAIAKRNAPASAPASAPSQRPESPPHPSSDEDRIEPNVQPLHSVEEQQLSPLPHQDDHSQPIVLPQHLDEIDDQAIAHLPPAMQSELFKQFKLQQRAKHRERMMSKQRDPAEFSKTQIDGFLHFTALNRKIKNVRHAINSKAGSSQRIASDSARQYILQESTPNPSALPSNQHEFDSDDDDDDILAASARNRSRRPNSHPPPVDILAQLRASRDVTQRENQVRIQRQRQLQREVTEMRSGVGWASKVLEGRGGLSLGGTSALGVASGEQRLSKTEQSSDSDSSVEFEQVEPIRKLAEKGNGSHDVDDDDDDDDGDDDDDSIEWEDGNDQASKVDIPGAQSQLNEDANEQHHNKPNSAAKSFVENDDRGMDKTHQDLVKATVKALPSSEAKDSKSLAQSPIDFENQMEPSAKQYAPQKNSKPNHDDSEGLLAAGKVDVHWEEPRLEKLSGESKVVSAKLSPAIGIEKKQGIETRSSVADERKPTMKSVEDRGSPPDRKADHDAHKDVVLLAKETDDIKTRNQESEAIMKIGDEEEQRELQMAIALSLGESTAAPKPQTGAAEKLSIQDSGSTTPKKKNNDMMKTGDVVSPSATVKKTSSGENINIEAGKAMNAADIDVEPINETTPTEADVQKTSVEEDKRIIAPSAIDNDDGKENESRHYEAEEMSNERMQELRDELELEAVQIQSEKAAQQGAAESVSDEMYSETRDLLKLFGIPYLEAPTEAEAQCAFLDMEGVVDGVITEDSDAFLFGARTVYRHLFAEGQFAEAYDAQDIKTNLGLDREGLIRLAYLLGSDYTPGVRGVGIVNSMEILEAFPGKAGLDEFRQWTEKVTVLDEEPGQDVIRGTSQDAVRRKFCWKHRNMKRNWEIREGFPNPAVADAYWKPDVDKNKERFKWGAVNFAALGRFCWEKFGWERETFEVAVGPLRKKLAESTGPRQRRIDEFFKPHRFAKIRSERLQSAVKGMAGDPSKDLMAEIIPRVGKRKRLPMAGVPRNDSDEEDSDFVKAVEKFEEENSRSGPETAPSPQAEVVPRRSARRFKRKRYQL